MRGLPSRIYGARTERIERYLKRPPLPFELVREEILDFDAGDTVEVY